MTRQWAGIRVRRAEGDLLLRPAVPADTERICSLLATAFSANPKARPEVYAWQYWKNPFGAPSVWVWEDAGEIVGHGGLFPVPGVLDGRPLVLGHAADAAVAVGHRGHGLYERLNRLRYDAAASRGMAVTMSLPNPQAWPGSAAAGLAPVGRVGAWVRPLDDGWLAGRLRLPRPAAVALRWAAFPALPSVPGAQVCDELPDGLDGLWDRTRGWSPCGIRRDAAWWRWRYASHPNAPYAYAALRRSGRLAAAAATRLVDGLSYVMDLLAEDEDAAAAVLYAAVNGRGLGSASGSGSVSGSGSDKAVGVALIALPGTRLAHLATACGLRRLPHQLEPRPMTLGVIAGTERDPNLAHRPWTVSWADHDHV